MAKTPDTDKEGVWARRFNNLGQTTTANSW